MMTTTISNFKVAMTMRGGHTFTRTLPSRLAALTLALRIEREGNALDVHMIAPEAERPLWPHQNTAANNVMRAWRDGVARRQCLVMPTGAGKTRVAAEITQRALSAGLRVQVFTHRRELVAQLSDRLPGVGVAGTQARVQVTTLQRGATSGQSARLGRDGIVIIDECHHLPVDQLWARELAEHFEHQRWLGLTATPQRADGKALGDTFDHMVVGAHYSDMLRDKRIVPCRVLCPPEQLDSGDMATDPLAAYARHVPGQQGFVFVRSISEADELADRFTSAGVLSRSITADTSTRRRDLTLRGFRDGEIRVITNVHTMTEGVDQPTAAFAILARKFGHASTYLQAVGRVLRAAPSKSIATIVDLCGSTLAHGLPTRDREYSLDGRGINPGATSVEAGLVVCQACGVTFEAGPQACPGCGEATRREKKAPKIWSLELAELYSGSNTPDRAKDSEYKRLHALAGDRGWSIGWVVKEYKKLFGHPPPTESFSSDDKVREHRRLKDVARAKGFRKGFAFVRYKKLFGHPPPWDGARR